VDSHPLLTVVDCHDFCQRYNTEGLLSLSNLTNFYEKAQILIWSDYVVGGNMPIEPERKKLCDDLKFAVNDEKEAIEHYKKVESQLNSSDNPAVRVLGVAVWMIKEDEEKHKNVLEKMERTLCRTF